MLIFQLRIEYKYVKYVDFFDKGGWGGMVAMYRFVSKLIRLTLSTLWG